MSRSGWLFHPMNLSFLAAFPRYLPIKATTKANIVLYINVYNVMVQYLGFKEEYFYPLEQCMDALKACQHKISPNTYSFEVTRLRRL